MTFYKIWRTYSRVHSGHNYSCISNEACAIAIPLPDVLQNLKNRVLVEWRKLDRPIVVAAMHLSTASPSLCLCQDSRSHGGHFEYICDEFMLQFVKLMPSRFLTLWFYCLIISFVAKNATCLKRFTWYGHYAREMEDIIIARPDSQLFLKSLC